jgi:alpha-mannosidase
MKKAGIEFFLTQKMLWNDTMVFPYYLFRWTAQDGSSILAHETVGSYDETVQEPRILEQMKQLNSRHNLHDLLMLFGKGDHGGGSHRRHDPKSTRIRPRKQADKGRFSTAEEYMRIVTDKRARTLPYKCERQFLAVY